MEAIFLTNRVIRNYLQLFNENKWKEVIKYTLIYGIQSLQCHYNLTQLSTQKLEEIIKNANFVLTAEDFHNAEISRLRAARSNADYLTSEMGIDPGYPVAYSDINPQVHFAPQNVEIPQPRPSPREAKGNISPRDNTGDDEFDEVVTVNMGPSGNVASSGNRNNNRNSRNNRINRNNNRSNYAHTEYHNDNGETVDTNATNGVNGHVFGEYVPIDSFKKQRASMVEYLDNPAPIKSQTNPLDPESAVAPEWFSQRESIPPVQPLRPPRRGQQQQPPPPPQQLPQSPPQHPQQHSDAKPPTGKKHGQRPKIKPKTGITATNVYYGQKGEPHKPPPPPVQASTRRRTPIKAESKIKSQVDADREAYKNHKTRKSAAQIAEDFYDGDVMEHFSEPPSNGEQDDIMEGPLHDDDFDEFPPENHHYMQQQQQQQQQHHYQQHQQQHLANPVSQQADYNEDTIEIPPELTRSVRHRKSSHTPHTPHSHDPHSPPESHTLLSSSPHVHIHAPGAQIFTSQPNIPSPSAPHGPQSYSQPSPPVSHAQPPHSQYDPSNTPHFQVVDYSHIPYQANLPQHAPPSSQIPQHTSPIENQQIPRSQTPPTQHVPRSQTPPAQHVPPSQHAPRSQTPPTQQSRGGTSQSLQPPRASTPHLTSRATSPAPQAPHVTRATSPHPQRALSPQVAPQPPRASTPHLTSRATSPYPQAPRAPSPQVPAHQATYYQQPTSQATQTPSHQATQTPTHQPTQTEPFYGQSAPVQTESKLSQVSLPQPQHDQSSVTQTQQPKPHADSHIPVVPPNLYTPGQFPHNGSHMGWSVHSEPTPAANSQYKSPNDTPHSFPITAPYKYHTSSHFEPELSSDNSPSTSPDNSPHTSPGSSRASTPPLTKTHPLPKAKHRSHSQSELYQTKIPHRARFSPHKSTRATPSHSTKPPPKHSTPYPPAATRFNARPPSPTPSHSSVEWVTLEGETEASDVGSHVDPRQEEHEEGYSYEFNQYNMASGAPHGTRDPFGGVGVEAFVEESEVNDESHLTVEGLETEEIVEKDISERGSPPIIHSHTHTHRHFIYPGDKIKNKDILPFAANINEAQGWDFDKITSQSDTDHNTRTVRKVKKTSTRRHSKPRGSQDPSSAPARPAEANTTNTRATQHSSAPAQQVVSSHTSTRTTRTYTQKSERETGVGDEDVNKDVGEDLERGLDMWKGSTMQIAARLRKAEQERKELQRQLLNQSQSSRSNSNS